MTDLRTDAVPALKRAVAPPGQFATLFPQSTDTELESYCLDGMAECLLDKVLEDYDWTGTVPGAVVTPDLDRAGVALVVIYASTNILQNEIRNRKSHVRYAAGNVSFEQDQAASVLVELLKEAIARKQALITAIGNGESGAAFVMFDQYLGRIGMEYDW